MLLWLSHSAHRGVTWVSRVPFPRPEREGVIQLLSLRSPAAPACSYKPGWGVHKRAVNCRAAGPGVLSRAAGECNLFKGAVKLLR